MWLCLNCHIPLANQRQFVVRGLHDGDIRRPVLDANPRYDGELAHEGITCAVCHVRDGTVIGLRGDTQAPHPVRVPPDMLSFEVCLTCHNALGQFGGTLTCNFDTGAKRISDNSFGFGEKRSFRYEIDFPQEVSAPTFEVVVENHRMTVEKARNMGLLGKYPLKREVLKTSVPLAVRNDQ